VGDPSGAALGFQASETALAALKLGNGLGEHVLGKIGPVSVQENELGVGALPEQKVADPI
jgi:hypothetical protein